MADRLALYINKELVGSYPCDQNLASINLGFHLHRHPCAERINWQEIVQTAKLRRKEVRISQQRLAALCGLSTPTISRFESGDEGITVASALAILKVLALAN